MAGEYRQKEYLEKMPECVQQMITDGFRIALTNQPIIGVTVRKDLSIMFSEAVRGAGLVDLANKIDSGAAVPVSPGNINRVYSPGELFFKS